MPPNKATGKQRSAGKDCEQGRMLCERYAQACHRAGYCRDGHGSLAPSFPFCMCEAEGKQSGCRAEYAKGVGGVHRLCAKECRDAAVHKGLEEHEGKEPEAKLYGRYEAAAFHAQLVTINCQTALHSSSQGTYRSHHCTRTRRCQGAGRRERGTAFPPGKKRTSAGRCQPRGRNRGTVPQSRVFVKPAGETPESETWGQSLSFAFGNEGQSTIRRNGGLALSFAFGGEGKSAGCLGKKAAPPEDGAALHVAVMRV